jgi:ABC-type branched-subunit amino acid transport system substrate-binding protein
MKDTNKQGYRKEHNRTHRRKFLTGLAGAGSVLLAGCSGDGGSGGSTGSDGETSDGESDQGGGTTTATTEQQAKGPIKIGLLTHLTGRFGFAGKNIQKSLDLVVKEARSSGGILGREIEVVTFDTKVKPQRALRGFETLAAEDVDIIVGPSSASIPTLFEPAKEREIPVISPTAGSTFLDTRGGTYVWRTTQSDSLLGRPQPLYASEQEWNSMGIAYLDNKGSQSFGSAIGSFFEEQGGSVTKEMALAPDATSYRSEIQTLVNSDPDVIHVTMSEDTFPLFIQNYRELGVQLPIMGGNEVTTSGMIDKVGADPMEGVIGVRTVPVENYSSFVSKYEEEYGEKPGIFAPEAYAMMNLAGLAWEQAGSGTREAIVNNLSAVGNPEGTKVTEFAAGKEALSNGDEIDYQGAATPCNFDENGNVFGPIAVAQVSDGEWTNAKVYSGSDIRQ